MQHWEFYAALRPILNGKSHQRERIRNSADIKLSGLIYNKETERYSFKLSYGGLKKLLPPNDNRIYETCNGSFDVTIKGTAALVGVVIPAAGSICD